MASELKVNKITPESGLTLTLGDSGDTINFGSGVLPNFENLTVTGDLTVDTNSLKVDSTNNFVGIGTASPTVALDVVGAITATGNITGTLATAAQPNITSLGTLTGLTTTGDINFGDNDKARFGATPTLELYSDGTNSWIKESGAGGFYIGGTNLNIMDSTFAEFLITGVTNGAVTLFYDNNAKLTTTSTGIDVTGTVVSDGLTVDGDAVFTTGDTIRLNTSDGSDNGVLAVTGGGGNSDARGAKIRFYGNEHASLGGYLEIAGGNVSSGHIHNYTNAKLRQKIDYNGDISFYEDTGTTPKLFWDASAESLGIGTTSPTYPLSILSSYKGIEINDGTSTLTIESNTAGQWGNKVSGNNKWEVFTNSARRLTIDGSGNVGIGTSSPNYPLTILGINSLARIYSDNTASELLIVSPTVNVIKLDTGTSDALAFGTTGTERMRIDSSGNVGIGTSSPSQKLHIVGSQLLSSPGSSVFTYFDSTSNYIGRNAATGDLDIGVNGSDRVKIDTSGHILPAVTNTQDLGSSSLVWRNIYTSDFHMSNEGLDKGNDIDGTKGSWTFQEGEENLYLINNKNGKKYKFNLTEVA